jgi:hypothetical protein
VSPAYTRICFFFPHRAEGSAWNQQQSSLIVWPGAREKGTISGESLEKTALPGKIEE